MLRPRLLLFGMLLMSCGCLLAGCETMQWIRPHQLWKLNRQPALGGDDGLFSIPAETSAPALTGAQR